jgi:hypothetical protein
MKTMATQALLGSMVCVATAADADEPAPGTRVRVTGPGETITHTGSLVGIDDRGVTVRVKDGRTVLVPPSEVTRLEVSRRPSRRGQGALIGMAVGGVAGFVYGSESNKKYRCNPRVEFCLFGEDGLFTDSESGAITAVPGVLIGAAIGALVGGGEKWRRVEDRRVQIRLAPSRQGGLALAVRF